MEKNFFSGLQKKCIGKTVGRHLILITFVLTVFTGNLAVRAEEPETPVSEPQVTTSNVPLSQLELKSNPFDPVRKRILPGTFLKVKVNKKVFDEKLGKIENIYLKYAVSPESNQKEELTISSWYFEEAPGDLYLFAKIPTWKELKHMKDQSYWSGILFPYKADIVIDYFRNGDVINTSFSVELPDKKWALIWAFSLSLLLVLLMAWGVTEQFSANKSLSAFSIQKLILSKGGSTVSVSKTQALIWTLITIFGIIYVYRISAVCMEITPQVLLLLGIGGGTAMCAKLKAVKRNEEKPVTKTEKPKKEKKEGGETEEEGEHKHDFFKVQMLSFSAVIAVIVVIEIIKTNAFPVLSENLVFAMGISNAVYFGNKIREKKQDGQGGEN